MIESLSPALTHVAVGVVHNAHGQVLFAQRPAGKPYAGWWEFPGGKIESGETVAQALARELREELGIQILDCHVWLTQRYVYPHASVLLHFCHVHQFKGNPQSLEGQAFAWGTPSLPPLPFLPAALSVLKAMQLPPILRLTAATELGFDVWRTSLNQLATGVVILHEPDAAEEVLQHVWAACQAWKAAAPEQRTLLVSSRHAKAWWGLADGVHLTQRDMLQMASRPSLPWVGASVHDAASLRTAAALGCNYVSVGTVLPTASHPQETSLGWGALGEMLADCEMASYALGGMHEIHLPLAQAAGAAGIACKRAAWT